MIKLKFEKLYVFLVLLVIAGCSFSPEYKIPVDADKEKLAQFYIYRSTAFGYHKFNPEKPFFYIDGQYVGKLGTGEFLSIMATSGKHIITVKSPLLFMPAFEEERIEIKLIAKQKYYLRYSHDIAGAKKIGNAVHFQGYTTLMPVPVDLFNERF